MARAGEVPPLRTLQREDRARRDDHNKRRERQHTEHVDPRGHVRRLTVGQQLVGRQRSHRALASGAGPGSPSCGAHRDLVRRPWPGNGTRSAIANTTSITAITMMFDTDMVKKCQCTVCAGWLRLKTAAMWLNLRLYGGGASGASPEPVSAETTRSGPIGGMGLWHSYVPPWQHGNS